MFKVENLCKKNSQRDILKNVTFEVEKGQVGIFLGGSGVGKSTLLRILNNLETYDKGTCRLDGEVLDLSQVNKDHTLGMIFQHFNLFENLNVLENITLSLVKVAKKTTEEAEAIAKKLLDRYGLLGHAHQSVGKLSGGQKQRLAIARTVALNPQVTCMDEPTSALDPKLTGEVAKLIMEIAQEGRTVLLTTHDIGLVRKLSGKIFLMEGGTIVETVLTEDYFSAPSRYPLLQKFLEGHE